MARSTVEIFPDRNFGLVHDIDEKPNIIEFALHNHDDIYEIVMLLNGDCEFCVEGNTYKINPGDIVFTRPFELHKMVCLSERTYERIILYIGFDYFKQHECEDYLEIFQNRDIGTGNLISQNIKDRALNNCFSRLDMYCCQKQYNVAEKIVYEFLYLMNRYRNDPSGFYAKDERVRKIIMYINDHLSENLNLDVLSKKFFIAKQYMCKVFKKNTGYTVYQYISYKRILLAQELYRNGQTLTQASMNAGFNDYANFYKTYMKYIGKSPKQIY